MLFAASLLRTVFVREEGVKRGGWLKREGKIMFIVSLAYILTLLFCQLIGKLLSMKLDNFLLA